VQVIGHAVVSTPAIRDVPKRVAGLAGRHARWNRPLVRSDRSQERTAVGSAVANGDPGKIED